MSQLDIMKLEDAYGCGDRCGGYLRGLSGVIDATPGDDLCEWYIEVPDGYRVEIDVHQFSVRSYTLVKIKALVVVYCMGTVSVKSRFDVNLLN